MEINTDILRIGDDYFAVKRIEAKGLDINEELKSLYEARHAQHVATLNDGVVQTAMEDWEKQINHLRSFENRGIFTVGRDDYNKPVMVYNEKYLKLRVILYAPCEIKTNYGYIRDRQRAAMNIPAIKEFVSFRDPHTEGNDTDYNTYDNKSVIIAFQPSFCVPLLVGYCERTNTLYTPRIDGDRGKATYHTMGGGNVCTGGNSAADFWSMDTPTLEREMNRINMFSPSTTSITIRGTTFDIRNLITEATFISIRNQGEDTWSA